MNRIITKSQCAFSLRKYIFDSMYMEDPASKTQQLIRSSIHTKIEGLNETIYSPTEPVYQSTQLPSGITVLTESVGVPSNVQLGIFLNIGTRDETQETSGSMLSIKNTYMKTAINTSETVNYGIAQMAGGEFEMNFNRENAFFRANCLSHDVIDVFSMIADCAFEPKNFVAANVGINKNEFSHKLDGFLGGNQNYNDDIYTAAYGNSNLGNPLYGNRSNVANLTGFVLQKFQTSNITPDRIVISATGIENHQEFVDLVSEKMFFTQLNSKTSEREPAQYVGGELRTLADSSKVNLAFAYRGACHKKGLPLLIAQEVLGNGRLSGRIQRNILNKNIFIDDAQAFSTSYCDTGLFGIKLSGSASHVQQITEVAAKQLSGLKSISNQDLQLAKQSLKGRITKAYTSNWKRIEDQSKSLCYTGKTNENYRNEIENVTGSEVQDAVAASLNYPLTLVARGGQVNKLASYDSISKLFQ